MSDPAELEHLVSLRAYDDVLSLVSPKDIASAWVAYNAPDHIKLDDEDPY